MRNLECVAFIENDDIKLVKVWNENDGANRSSEVATANFLTSGHLAAFSIVMNAAHAIRLPVPKVTDELLLRLHIAIDDSVASALGAAEGPEAAKVHARQKDYGDNLSKLERVARRDFGLHAGIYVLCAPAFEPATGPQIKPSTAIAETAPVPVEEVGIK